MRLHNIITQTQTSPVPETGRLGCEEERLKYRINDVLRNAVAIISHADLYFAIYLFSGNGDCWFITCGLGLCFFVHCVKCIVVRLSSTPSRYPAAQR